MDNEKSMKDKQFDQFWEMRCPKCNTTIDIEILINQMIANSEDKKN